MIRSSALWIVLSLLLTACGGGGGGSDAEFIDDRVLLQSIRVTPADSSLAIGLTQNFTATGEYSDGSEQNLTSQVNWLSASADIASINTDGLATAVSTGSTDISATFEGIEGSTTLTVTAPVVVETAILPPSADIPLGGTQDYRAFAIYSDGSFENVTFTAEWALQNESGIIEAYEPVLTRGLNALDDFGTVVGVEIGQDALLASFANIGTESSVAVVDPQLTSLSISPRNDTQPAGATVNFTATGNYSDGTNSDLTKVVNWASSDEGIASISNEPGERGVANALSPGEVSISASFEGITDQTPFTVIDDGGDDIVRVDVLPPMATIGVGESQSYMAIAITQDGDSFDVTKSASWSSSNGNIATIDASGLAIGVSGGSVSISAVFNEVTGSASLTVEAATVLESISISPADSRQAPFTRMSFTANGNYTDGSSRDITDSVTWQSGDRTTILVSNDPEFGHGVAFTLLPGETTVSATLNGITGETTIEVIDPTGTPAQLVVSPAFSDVPIGGTQQFRAEIVFEGRSAVDVSDVVTWTSLNSLIAEVDASGLATGLNPGSANIEAALNLGEFSFESTAVLRVLPPPVVVQEIIISPPSASVIVGDTQAFTARALLSNNTDIDVTNDVSWSTTDGTIAVIDLNGVATGVAIGEADVKARLKVNGDVFEDLATLTVVAPALTGLEVSPSRIEVLPGTNTEFTARAYFENGTSEDVTDIVAWSSSDTAVASVNASGLATAIAPGASDITATVIYQGNTFTDSGRLVVKEAPVTITELVIDPATAEILVEGKQAFTARVILSDNTDQDVTNQVSWISSDPAIASINGLGRATGLTPGDTTIEAALLYEGETYNDTASLTVLPPLVTIDSLVVEPPNDTILVDGTSQFTARVILSDSTSQDVTDQVTWVSTVPEVAHVNGTGLATGLVEGKSDIQATLSYEGETFTDSGRLTVNPAALTITEVRVIPVTASVFVDGKIQFTAEAVLSDDSVIDVTTDVSWLAVDGGIASITATGRATGLAPGQTDINATLSYNGDTFTGTAVLTVNPPEITVDELLVEPVNAQVLIGSSQQFTARLIFSDSSQQDITDTATWVSSNTDVASVTLGLATGLVAGGSDISASVMVDGTTYSDSGRLTVSEPASIVTSIRVDPASAEILVGTTQQYLATAVYNDGSETDITRDVTWQVDDTSIAHISGTGLTTGVSAGTAVVTASFVSGSSSFTDTASLVVQPLPVTVTELIIAPETAEVLIGGTVAYTATAKLSDDSEQDVTNNVAWVSGQPGIAQIDSSGVATGVAEGDAAIKAQLTYGDGETIRDSVTLTVKAPLVTVDSIQISPDSADVLEGEQTRYTATAFLSDNSEVDVSRDVTWTSSDETIASVNKSGLATGILMGTTSINANLPTPDGAVSDSATINVAEPPPVLVRIDVFPPAASLPLGTTQDFRAIAVFDDDSTQNVTFDGTWSLSKTPPILERYEPNGVLGALDEFGTAIAINVGEDTLSFDYQGVTGTSAVEVTEPSLVSLTISPRSVVTSVGTVTSFSATGVYDNNESRDVTDAVTWSSSDAGVATISNSSPTRGDATAVALGQTTISAALDSKSDSTTLTVNDDPLVRVEVSPADNTLPIDGMAQYSADAVYASGLTQDVTNSATWSSADSAIATVSATGLATGIAEGTTIVSAEFMGTTGNGNLAVSGNLQLTGLTIDPASTMVNEFQTFQFQAFGNYNDGSVRNTTSEVTWSSDDATVFAISNDDATFGKGLGIGLTPDQSTTVRVIMPGTSIGASASVDVIALGDGVRKLEVTPVTAEVLIGETQQYQANVFLTDGSQIEVTEFVVWSSGDETIARIDGTGLATGEAAGDVTISASLFQLPDLNDSVTLTVKAPVTINDIVVSPPAASVLEGDTTSYTAQALLSDNTSIDITDDASWSTDDSATATAATGGIVTGVSAGTTGVNATINYEGTNYQGSASVEVLPLVVIEEIVITPPTAEILEGGTQQFTATARLSDNQDIDITDDASWQSSDNTIAQIAPGGLASGLTEGVATITASIIYEGVTYSGTSTLTVTAVTVDNIQITPKRLETLPGDSVQFTATAVLTDLSTVDVTDQAIWFTTDDSIAVVESGENAGRATGVSDGVVAVYVEFTYDGVEYPCLGISSCQATLEVKPLEVTAIQVTPATAEVDVGATISYTATAILNNGDSVEATDQVTWKSSDNSIASVNASGVAQGVTEGTVTITASVVDGTETISGTASLDVLPPPVTVEEIVVTPANVTILTGGSQAYTATAILSDNSSRDVTSIASWLTDDKTIARIGPDGVAVGLAAGTTQVEAQVTYEGITYSGNTPITVEDPVTVVSVRISPQLADLLTGDMRQFSAFATLSNSSVIDITQDAIWHTGSAAVATVGQGKTAGEVTAVGPGKTEVWVDYQFDGVTFMCENNADCEALITVSDPITVERLTVAPSTANILLGSTQQYSATAELSDGNFVDVTSSVTWSSDNTAVAAPQNTTGLFVGISPGTATISASGVFDGITLTDSGTLVVEPPATVVDRVEVLPATSTKFVGEQQAFTATAYLSNGDVLDVTTNSVWQSDNTNDVAIDPVTGVATAVADGSATITASFTYEGAVTSGTATMTSVAPILESIDLIPLDQTVVVSATVQYTATGNYSDGSSRSIDPNWSSSAPGVADISTEGIATALSGGTTSISAELDSITATTSLTVEERMIDDLWIFPSSISDAAGTLGKLVAEAHFNDNTTEDVTLLAEWSSDDSTIATVVNTGFLKGGYALRNIGNTTISASYAGFTDTITVEVSAPPLVSIIVTPAQVSTPVGIDVAFRATGIYANLTSTDLTDDVVWSSDNTAVSSITEDGIATGLQVGEANITAAFDGKVGSAIHGVKEAVVEAVILSPPEAAGPSGTSISFSAFAQYTDGSQEDVTLQADWVSSNTTVVSVGTEGDGQPGLADLLTAGTANVGVSFSGFSDEAPVTVTEPVVVDLFVNPYGETYPAGLLVEFTAIATYDNGTDLDVTQDAVWHSLDSDVIVPNPARPGQFQTVEPGTTEVTATFAEFTEDSPVTVTPAQVTEIQIEPPNPTGPAGTQDPLKATAFYDNLTSEDITDQATWQSDDPAIANVVPEGVDQGLLQFVAEGSTTISATFKGVTQTTTATTTAAILVDILVEPPNQTIANGLTLQYEAIGIYSDGSSSPLLNSGGILSRVLTDEVFWGVTNPSVAEINPDGLVTTIGVGDTQVRAAFQNITGSTNLTVSEATVRALEIQPITSEGPAGTDERIQAIATLTDESTLDVSDLVVWGSSSGFVATVAYDAADDRALLSYNNEGTATISATLGEGDDAIVANAEAITTSAILERIELLPNPISIAAGTVFPTVATGFFSDGSIQILNDDADFTSADPTTVSVTNRGLVAGAAIGTTTVTASIGDISGSTTVEVTDAILIELQITPADIEGPAGTEVQLIATGFYSDGGNQELTSQVTWRSASDNIASVANGGADSGLLQLVSEGDTQIAAVLDEVVDTVDVSVTAAALSVIRVQPVLSFMPDGTSQQMAAVGEFTDGSSTNLTNQVSWSSSATNKVQINASGLATAYEEGLSTIRATLDDVVGLAEILVTEPDLANIQITPSTLVEPAGSSGQFTATGIYSNGQERDLTNDVVWSSSDTSIVTVNNFVSPGLARLIQVGMVDVTASLDGIFDSVPVEVTAAFLTEIRVTPSVESVAEGTTVQYSATGVFSDGSTTPINEDVAWTSSNTEIARIDGSGLADTIGVGDVEIRATVDDIVGVAQLEVTDAVPERLEIQPASSPALLVGQARQYDALLTYSDGETAIVTTQVDWTVSPSEIASPQTTPGLILGAEPGTGEVIARYGSFAFGRATSALEARVPLEVAAPVITSVEINTFRESGQPVEIPAGRAESWQAFANFSDGTFVDITETAVWNSSTQSVATVLDGDVDAVSAGTTDISIFYIDLNTVLQAPSIQLSNFTDSVELTVTNAELVSIDINPDEATIAPNQTASFTAIGSFSDGSSQNITGDANWDTSDADVAVVERVEDQATIRGLDVGVTNVTVNQSGITAAAILTVTDAQIPETLVVSDALPISVGSQWPFTATVTYTDGDTAVVTNDATWSSSDTDVATIYNVPDQATPRGTATTLTEGSTTITATFGGASDSTTLTVTGECEASGPNGKPDSVFIIPEDPILPNIGDVVQMQAIGVFLDDCQLSLTLDPQTQWKVLGKGGSNKIIEVNEQGLVTGLKCGTGEVEANHRGVKATMDVQVCN